MVDRLMETGTVRRQGRGRPRVRPRSGRAGYGLEWSEDQAVSVLPEIGMVIAREKRESHIRLDKEAYRERNVVERSIGRITLHQLYRSHQP